MYYSGYIALLVSFLAASAAAAAALYALYRGSAPNALIRHAHLAVSAALLLASAVLLHALFWQDYSLQYAANYTDRYLSVFYRLTAFWAGQPGSMLFWALVIALSGTVFTCTRSYEMLAERTRLWFWVFFHSINVFFALLLTSYSNPFIMQTPVPADGNGLNPLLQNPGMIIHPPLLFLGYAGFVVPACLALAESLSHGSDDPASGRPDRRRAPSSWAVSTRGFMLVAWMFLTAGILLGAWWAYMELGWGGYWAWDPVENSSLIPWLLATATLHTLIIERRTGKLSRYNTFLICLTTISTFFATFLVRSGVIDSVHAFGRGSVGTPLLLLVCISLILTTGIVLSARRKGDALAPLPSREGLMALMSWFLMALSVIILLATLWPVISPLFSKAPQGLDASFYNRVCLPLAAVLLSILAFCSAFAWNSTRVLSKGLFALLLGTACIAALLLASTGYSRPVPLLATAASASILAGMVWLLWKRRKNTRIVLTSAGTHIGLALVALAVAFSGPYSTEEDVYLRENETTTVGGYTLVLEKIANENHPGFSALVARISVSQNDSPLGTLQPERRIYEKFGEMQFSEVDTIPSLGNELYVSLLGLTSDRQVLVRFSIKPLVNWLWIGGILMSLLPVCGLYGRRTKDSPTSNA